MYGKGRLSHLKQFPCSPATISAPITRRSAGTFIVQNTEFTAALFASLNVRGLAVGALSTISKGGFEVRTAGLETYRTSTAITVPSNAHLQDA